MVAHNLASREERSLPDLHRPSIHQLFPRRVLFWGTFSLSWLLLHLPHRELSVLGFLLGFLGYQKASAPGSGQPNAAEQWLKGRGLVGDAFSVSLRGGCRWALRRDG